MVFVKPTRSLLYHALLTSPVLGAGCWQGSDCTGPLEPSFSGPWEANTYSPASRTLAPVSILDSSNNVVSSYPGDSNLIGDDALLVFDFGQEVGGIVTLNYTASGDGTLGLAFTEAKNFTGSTSDSSNGGSGTDGFQYQNISSTSAADGTYTLPLANLRGGFRYLTLFNIAGSSPLSINITGIELEIAYQPTWSNLQAYGGYFHSSDSLLNRIWYACTYTVQTNTVPANTGRVWPAPSSGWFNNAVLSNSSSVVVDGAKRDRAIWSGDLGISIPSVLIGTGDLESVQNTLTAVYSNQQTSGEIFAAGPPISMAGSDSYHMISMIATHDYVLYSNDLDWLASVWTGYQNAMTFITGKIDSSTGLINVTGGIGWGRTSTESGYSTTGNMLLYRTLTSGAKLAEWMGQSSLATTWEDLAATLKAAVNSESYNWDSSIGAFKNTALDNSVYPEDGNSMALYFDGADASYGTNISKQLLTNWGTFGAVTPECPGNIVPFIESYEIKGHLAIRETQNALDLMRLSWGWYLNNPYGTESSILEGYYEDGSFEYRDSDYNKGGTYTSHSHGWSTGPTDALVSYVVGLRPTAPGGSQWTLEPQFGDLSSAEGGFTTPLGKYSAKWALTNSTGYTLEFDVPQNTSGVVLLPSQSRQPQVSWNGTSSLQPVFNASTGLTQVSATGGNYKLSIVY